MINISAGRYWDKAWSLVDGCTPCSPGCDHCWSARLHHRFQTYKNGWNPDRLTDIDCKFTGQIQTHPERLDIPPKRRKSTVYAVWNDLHHKSVPMQFKIDAYSVMLGCNRHTYLILTKRPYEMLRYFKKNTLPGYMGRDHIWHGLTICNQQEADEKIPIFLQVPGKKFLSIEPMLEEIDITKYLYTRFEMGGARDMYNKLDAVILGGETLGNRPGRKMKIEWVESIVNQCEAANVPLFIKQIHLNRKVSKDINEWPKKLRRRELPWLKRDR